MGNGICYFRDICAVCVLARRMEKGHKRYDEGAMALLEYSCGYCLFRTYSRFAHNKTHADISSCVNLSEIRNGTISGFRSIREGSNVITTLAILKPNQTKTA